VKAAHGTLTPQNSIVSVSAMHKEEADGAATDEAAYEEADEAAATVGIATEDEVASFRSVDGSAVAEGANDDNDDDDADAVAVDWAFTVEFTGFDDDDGATCFLGAGRANRPANEAADGAVADCVCTLVKC
jgi:hypothetical protein